MITSFKCIAATTQVLPRNTHQSIFHIKITKGANRAAQLFLRVCTTQALCGTGSLASQIVYSEGSPPASCPMLTLETGRIGLRLATLIVMKTAHKIFLISMRR